MKLTRKMFLRLVAVSPLAIVFPRSKAASPTFAGFQLSEVYYTGKIPGRDIRRYPIGRGRVCVIESIPAEKFPLFVSRSTGLTLDNGRHKTRYITGELGGKTIFIYRDGAPRIEDE